jgi:hypothetical protein
MVRINKIHIEPPVINASCSWASELAQLEELYNSPYTGAVTTRTATLDGFPEDSSHTVGNPPYPAKPTLTGRPPGGIREQVGIDPEFVRLFASPTFELHPVDPFHPLP